MPEEIKTPASIQEGLKPSDRSRKTRKTASAKHDRMQGKKIKEKKLKEAILVFSESKTGSVVAMLVMGKTTKSATDELTVEGMARLRSWALKEAAGARITTMVQAKEAFLKESGTTTGFLKSHPAFAVYIAYLHIRGWKMARASMVGSGHAEFYSGSGHDITIENGKWKLHHKGSDVSGNTPEDLEEELVRQMI